MKVDAAIIDKCEEDYNWLLERARDVSMTCVECFQEKVARFTIENGMTEEDARNEAFGMLGAVYQ